MGETRYERLRDKYPNINDSETTSFLFDEAKGSADLKLQAIKALEAKATAQIGVILGVGVFSTLGSKPAINCILVLAIVFLICSILANAIALLPEKYKLPLLEPYNDDAIVAEHFKARIQYELTAKYLDYGEQLTKVSAKKAVFYTAGSGLLVLGVILLVFSFLFGQHAQPQPNVNCTFLSNSIHCSETEQTKK